MFALDNALLAAFATKCAVVLRIFTPDEDAWLKAVPEPSASSLVGTGTVGLMIIE